MNRPLTDTPDCSAIVVSYNVAAYLRRCLESLDAEYARSGIRGQTIVVDNASADGSADVVASQFPHVRLIRAPRNEGFAAGCARGLAASRAPRLLWLNPDADLRPGALSALQKCLDHHPQAAVAVPLLTDAAGQVQHSRRRFPRLATLFAESTAVQWWWPQCPLLQGYYLEDRPVQAAGPVDWATGACWLVRRTALEQVGGLDRRFFMYFEELDQGLRLAAAGWHIRYEPAARVRHHGSRSADQHLLGRDLYFHQSKYQFAHKWWGRLAAVALRSFVAATILGQLGEEAAKWLVATAARQRHAQRLAILAPLLSWHITGRAPPASAAQGATASHQPPLVTQRGQRVRGDSCGSAS